MRKLYNEFFYIPKHGKVREKVMLTRIAMTVTIVIMCLAAMSITAYAYFSYNITSGSNIIKAANFEANVSITDSNNDPVTVTKDGKVQTANLDAGKYTIELTKGNSTADTGFCVISIGDKTYYTDQIGVDVKKDLTDATVKFDLWLSSPTKLEVLSHWGTSVYYGYGDDGRTEIFIVSDATVDLTTNTTSGEGQSETGTDQSEETTTTSTNTTTGTESSSTQTPESTTTTPSTETSTPVETSPPETTGTSEPTSTTEPVTQTTEPASTETTAETQPATETTETTDTTGTTTTEANE